MTLNDTLRTAIFALRGNWMRSALTSLGVIIGIADQNVEHHALVQLTQACLRIGEAGANDVGKLGVACVASRQFIETEQRE